MRRLRRNAGYLLAAALLTFGIGLASVRAFAQPDDGAEHLIWPRTSTGTTSPPADAGLLPARCIELAADGQVVSCDDSQR